METHPLFVDNPSWLKLDEWDYLKAFKHYRELYLDNLGIHYTVKDEEKFKKFYIKEYPENSKLLKLI
jgi:hypothetical protein